MWPSSIQWNMSRSELCNFWVISLKRIHWLIFPTPRFPGPETCMWGCGLNSAIRRGVQQMMVGQQYGRSWAPCDLGRQSFFLVVYQLKEETEMGWGWWWKAILLSCLRHCYLVSVKKPNQYSNNTHTFPLTDQNFLEASLILQPYQGATQSKSSPHICRWWHKDIYSKNSILLLWNNLIPV